MERAFDKGAAEMARRRARARRPSDAPPETLGGAAVGAAREGLLAVADAALVTLAGARAALEVAYDGDLSGIAYGTPAQARAFRALRDDGDARHFLLVEGQKGEDALLLEYLNLLPVDELAERVAEEDADRNDPEARARAEQPRLSDEDLVADSAFKSLDLLSIPELHKWRERWVDAAYQVAEYLAGRTREAELVALSRGDELDDSQQAAASATLTPAELLLMFAVADKPRGYAGGDERIYQAIQTIRTRLRRRLEKPSSSVSE